MAGRAREYIDDLLGRNDGREEAWERTRASRNRPRAGYRDYNPNGTTRSFDYSVRENEDYASFREDEFRSERDRGHFGKGPKNWKWSDERIKEQVSEELFRNYRVDASEIEVDVKDGIVTLSGTVTDREAKRMAEQSIENLSGVIDVHNRLRIMERKNLSLEKRSLS